MYIGYVKHTKFINAKTKPQVAFMQNSLIEIFAIDHTITYQYGFLYIRQMAIHLRNAITMKKKVTIDFIFIKLLPISANEIFIHSAPIALQIGVI